MTTIQYDPSRPRIADCSEYHRVTNWPLLVKALDMPVLGFKVGNGWLSFPLSDSTFPGHLKGAESNDLIAIGYWFGAQKVDAFLTAFPPKEGRIACLDFEFLRGHTITHKDAEDASAFVARLHTEWGRWPWFYGHSTWINAGEPAGTNVEQCPYWGPTYGSSLSVPRGVGKPVAHQYAASSRGPKPWHMDGVADGSLKGSDGLGIGPDMNSMLVSFDVIKEMAGIVPPPPPGGNMAEEADAVYKFALDRGATVGDLGGNLMFELGRRYGYRNVALSAGLVGNKDAEAGHVRGLAERASDGFTGS